MLRIVDCTPTRRIASTLGRASCSPGEEGAHGWRYRFYNTSHHRWRHAGATGWRRQHRAQGRRMDPRRPRDAGPHHRGRTRRHPSDPARRRVLHIRLQARLLVRLRDYFRGPALRRPSRRCQRHRGNRAGQRDQQQRAPAVRRDRPAERREQLPRWRRSQSGDRLQQQHRRLRPALGWTAGRSSRSPALLGGLQHRLPAR